MQQAQHKKKEPQGSVGIKNSWKYEKDLVIILNGISVIYTITLLSYIFKPALPIKIFNISHAGINFSEEVIIVI